VHSPRGNRIKIAAPRPATLEKPFKSGFRRLSEKLLAVRGFMAVNDSSFGTGAKNKPSFRFAGIVLPSLRV
jgi:hypothetical protein